MMITRPKRNADTLRVVQLTDPHLCPLGNKFASRTDEFHQHIDNKWQSMCDMLDSLEVDHVVLSGDLLHLKTQSNYQPRDINRMSAKMEALGRPLSIIPGNHDLPKSSIDNYEQTAFKASVRAASNALDVSMNDKGQLEFKNHYVRFLNGRESPVVVTGLPYVSMSLFDSMVQYFHDSGAMDPYAFNITMLHVDALPREKALPLPFETFIWKDLVQRFPYSDILCLGHIHQSFPMEMHLTAAGKKQIISKPWSFSRSVNDVYVRTEVLEQQHRPAIALFDIDINERTTEALYIEIPHVPFREAFNVETLSKEIKESEKIISMVTGLKDMIMAHANQGTLADNPLEIMKDLAQRQQISDEIIHLTLHYLTEAGVR